MFDSNSNRIFINFLGRVHSAVVSTINFDLQSATVEWCEQGETKGKEIDLTAIEALNPEVLIIKPGERYIQEPSSLNQTSLNKLQRVMNVYNINYIFIC